ncbi:MAG: ATP synthase subunit I [Desulfocapsaceae bacterium]|nr:ATP synthase subunit I [Desulfocapsaceae bacterium]
MESLLLLSIYPQILLRNRFYFIAHGHWQRLLLCLLGFIIARLVVTRLTRAAEKPVDLAPEASHAP